MACDHFGFANLTASGVWHTASAGLLFHSAGCVGNLPSNALADHAARCIGNSASDAFFVIAARRVRNFAGAGLADHRATQEGDQSRNDVAAEVHSRRDAVPLVNQARSSSASGQ